MSVRSQIAQIVTACGAAAAFLTAASALAEPAEVVYASSGHAPASDKSLVPGGLPGFPEARFTNFNNKIFRTPSTNQWMVVATTTATPTSQDQVFVVAPARPAAVMAQEGITEIATGEFINFSRLDVPRMNDAGKWAMGFRLNITGAAATDERLVRWGGTGFDLILKANDPVPAQPGMTYFGSFNSANITANSSVGYLAGVNPAIANVDSAFTDSGATLVAEVNVSIPANQSPASGNGQWADLDADTFMVSDDGAHWIALGEVGLNTAADKVAVVDGAVVLQEGSVIAGTSFIEAVSSIAAVWMEPNGDWFARGSNVGGIDWVVRNGALIATEGSARRARCQRRTG